MVVRVDMQDLLDDPDVSMWLKDAIFACMRRDPLDAVHDAILLSAVMGKRADEALAEDLAMMIALEEVRGSNSFEAIE